MLIITSSHDVNHAAEHTRTEVRARMGHGRQGAPLIDLRVMLEGRRVFGAVTIESAGPAEEQDLFDSLIAQASRRRP